MERRKFMIGVGSLAAGGAAATGTGAFTATQANRTVSVSTTTDASGYLGLEGLNSDYVTDDGDVNNGNGVLEIQLDEVNPNSVTAFTKLFKITNQSSDDVDVWGDPEGPHSDHIVFPFGGVTNDSYSSLRQVEPPTISAEIFEDPNDGGSINGATEYNNGNVPEGSGGRTTIESGKSKTVSIVVDTRPDDVSVNDQLLNSITIFADKLEAENEQL